MNWTRSSYCAADRPQCVEVATVHAGFGRRWVLMRDSKLGAASPVERFTRRQWRIFTRRARVRIAATDGMYRVGDLAFDAEEWRAFLAGIRGGEFEPARLP